MRIRTQLILTVLLFGILLAAISASAIYTNQQVEHARQQENAARNITLGAEDLNYLSNDYVIYRESQQLARWQSRYASFSSDVAGLQASGPEEQTLVRNIQANQQRLKEVFDSIATTVGGFDQNPSTVVDPAFLQVSWSRIAVQSQGLISDSSRLAQLQSARVDQLQRTNLFTVIALIGLFAAYFIINFLTVQRRTLKSLAALQAGASTIGSGNLDFKIQEKRNDEIGDLARAFNRMTSSLKTVTASKADLEKEIAEHKQTESALKESEARATALIKYAPTGIYEIDMNGPRFLSANDAVSILTGYSREELFAMGPMGLLDGDSRRLFAERIRHQLAGDKIDETVDYKVKKKDGSLIAITLNASFSKQRPGTAFVIGHDVTERRQAEEALRQSEEKYRLLYTSMNDGMALHEIVYDEAQKAVDYNIIDVNPMYSYITGLTREQAVGKKGSELYGTNEPPYLDIYASVASNGNSRSFETYFPPMDKYFSISVFSPRPGSFATVFSDISARKKAEQDISNLAVKRQLLHEATLQVVAEKDISGLMTRVADAARALTGARISVGGHGYVNGQFIVGGSSNAEGIKACPQGKDFGVERGGIYLDLIKTRRSIRLSNEELQKHLSWWGLPEGHAPLNGLLGTSLFDSSGQPNGMIMVSDKTEGEKFSATDEAFLSQLASITSLAIQQVESRRAAEQKAAELEVSNKELESFSYTVSHDLRAPLRGMDGFSLAVLEDYGNKLDAQGRTYLQNIRISSQLMARLIDDILSLSRVTRATLNWDEVDLTSLAEDVQTELKKTRPERQVEFIIQPGLVTHGDRNLLKLVLDNLLGNAYKFTGKYEHSRIEFGMKNEAGENIFFVKDNGAGFDMTYADKLFLPFQRLHKAEDFPGTGIGLASVHRIIARHGGRIWAESEIEKGATFYFTIREEK